MGAEFSIDQLGASVDIEVELFDGERGENRPGVRGLHAAALAHIRKNDAGVCTVDPRLLQGCHLGELIIIGEVYPLAHGRVGKLRLLFLHYGNDHDGNICIGAQKTFESHSLKRKVAQVC